MFPFSLLSWTDALVLLVVAFGALFVWRFHIAPNATSYANLPGPPLRSYVWGNMQGLISCVLALAKGAEAGDSRARQPDASRLSPQLPARPRSAVASSSSTSLAER
jgi:hypothetical protein